MLSLLRDGVAGSLSLDELVLAVTARVQALRALSEYSHVDSAEAFHVADIPPWPKKGGSCIDKAAPARLLPSASRLLAVDMCNGSAPPLLDRCSSALVALALLTGPSEWRRSLVQREALLAVRRLRLEPTLARLQQFAAHTRVKIRLESSDVDMLDESGTRAWQALHAYWHRNEPTSEKISVPFEQGLAFLRCMRPNAYVHGGRVIMSIDQVPVVLIEAAERTLRQELHVFARARAQILQDEERVVEVLDWIQGLWSAYTIPEVSLQVDGAGLCVTESVELFTSEYRQAMGAAAVARKRYAYSIRHLYGLEGSRIDHSPQSCSDVLQGEGCPFRSADAQQLKQALHVRADQVDIVTGDGDHPLAMPMPSIQDQMVQERQNQRSEVLESMENEYREHKVKIIANFNYKGGIGKTTSSMALGWELAEQGKRRNSLFLAFAPTMCDIRDVRLLPAQVVNIPLSSQREERPFSTVTKDNAKRSKALFLLPGALQVSKFAASILKSEGGASRADKFCTPRNVLQMTAWYYNIDTIVLDLAPSLDAFTRLCAMSAHAIITPCLTDLFSCEALSVVTSLFQGRAREEAERGPMDDERKLRRLLNLFEAEEPNWNEWLQQEIEIAERYRPDLMRPSGPKFLGCVITRYQRAHVVGGMTRNAHFWYDRLKQRILGLIGTLGSVDFEGQDKHCEWYQTNLGVLGWIEDANQLSAISHREGIPVCHIRPEMLKTSVTDDQGNTRLRSMEARERHRILVDTLPRMRVAMVALVQRLLKGLDEIDA
ncbi:uncharacterized protein MONBRDRAFT_9650 [Monosiga brevicollis MX1]|uniref:AAA domain-containing protein n=1 Tax=Monosiga brevicollis TaxID=81824 RepID=A9V3Y8_MONBE|nr:uncharacterized protein MONBRDRAFT_9650 [Monosiga brevicollis MX1]EDQ87888.1 predicted protein [Monosiga brevicollis MX1]|eukprot:XP_001747421.1 hypothetical protein [Monosiga brevicollis MX1]